MARSATFWFSRNEPDWESRRSISVVLPWSTWAMMAILRKFMWRTDFLGLLWEFALRLARATCKGNLTVRFRKGKNMQLREVLGVSLT